MAAKPIQHELKSVAARLSELKSQAAAELISVNSQIDELTQRREVIQKAPLHNDDLLPQMRRHIEKQAAIGLDFIRQEWQNMRHKTPHVAIESPDVMACYSPIDTRPEVIAAVLVATLGASELAEAMWAALGGLDDCLNAGAVITERRIELATIADEIDALIDRRNELQNCLS